MVVAINACVLVLSVILMIISRAYYMQMIRAFGIEGSGLLISLIVAVVIMGCITTGNIIAIKRKINSLWIQD
jgi:hypothetical protein